MVGGLGRHSGAALRVVAGDAGGASALVPVLLSVDESPDLSAAPLAYDRAAEVWRARGIAFDRLAPSLPAPDYAGLLEGFDLLLTATSANGIDHERHLTVEARGRALPTLAVLDYWSNYRQRFGPPAQWPDRIAVMDERAREEMVACGFDVERLLITGHPALDEVHGWRAQSAAAVRAELRQRAGARSEDIVVLYASSPVGVSFGTAEPVTDPGYDTFSALALLIESLEELAHEVAGRLTLIVRPHPRENSAAFEGFRGRSVRVLIEAGGHGRDWLLAADVVSGTTSMLLVEACHLGKPTVSIQPGLRSPDFLPTNRTGLSLPVYRYEDALPTLRRVLLDPSERTHIAERLAAIQQQPSATDRVLDAIREMIRR